jgi:hypothetical protein
MSEEQPLLCNDESVSPSLRKATHQLLGVQIRLLHWVKRDLVVGIVVRSQVQGDGRRFENVEAAARIVDNGGDPPVGLYDRLDVVNAFLCVTCTGFE